MSKLVWHVVFLILLSLPNIVSLWYDPIGTKFAGLLVPLLLFFGLNRLIKSPKGRLLWSLPLIVFSLVSLAVLIQFNSQFTEGVLDAIINSDLIEISEFLKDTNLISYYLIVLYIGVFIYLYTQADKIRSDLSGRRKRIWITLLLIFLPVIDMLGKGASARSYPLILVQTSYNYVAEMISMRAFLEERRKFKFDAKISGDPKDETFIFVIGETSRRDFYSLYNYSLNTNPELSKLKNLVVFTDAISPANATVLSLRATLHLSTTEDESLFYKTKSIVSLAKEAGYRTWWLSAQSQFGKHETSVTSSGIESDKKVFHEGGRTLDRIYDGVLLPSLDDSLSKPYKHKFIVMHLYGSHILYRRRYPEEFDTFNGIPPNYHRHPKEIQEKVNNYVNSIAYTDFVISKIIQKTAQQKKASCVVYTADHGEYLADNPNDNFFGHGRALPYKVEVEVPLLVWCSKEYRQQYPHKWNEIMNNRKAPINIEDMFYSLSDLMHINYDLMKPERSFFSGSFVPVLPRKTRSSSTRKLFNYSQLK